MGDWSDNLEYEQREYYGHFYDTDEDVHEEETDMSDLISRQAVLDDLSELLSDWDDDYNVPLLKAIGRVEDLPSVENKGEWIVQPSNKEQGERDFIWWKCSKCGQVIYSETEKDREEYHAFCGRCGADMRGET